MNEKLMSEETSQSPEDLLVSMYSDSNNDTTIDNITTSFEEDFFMSLATTSNLEIPEITNIILSRFDEKIGPIVFLAENYEDCDNFELILSLFDSISVEHPFFFEIKGMCMLSKLFCIPNPRRRGKQDMLMITFELKDSNLDAFGKKCLYDLIEFFTHLIETERDFGIFNSESYEGVSEIKLEELIHNVENIFDTFIGVITNIRAVCKTV